MSGPDGAYVLTPARVLRVADRLSVAPYWYNSDWPTLEVLSWFEHWPDQACYSARVPREQDQFPVAELGDVARSVLVASTQDLNAAERWYHAEFRSWPEWCR